MTRVPLVTRTKGTNGAAPRAGFPQAEVSSPLISTTDERATELLGETADERGDEMLRAGLTVAQVVEGYGDVCQAITDEAIGNNTHIAADEYRTLNLCLEIATARGGHGVLARA